MRSFFGLRAAGAYAVLASTRVASARGAGAATPFGRAYAEADDGSVASRLRSSARKRYRKVSASSDSTPPAT